MLKTAFIFIVLIFGAAAYCEQSGSINITTANMFVTGLSGSTIFYCNATSDCMDSSLYTCLLDYDIHSNYDSAGWCAPASQSGCAHSAELSINYNVTSSGSSYCYNSSSYLTCSSGVWSNSSYCDSGKTCSDGACASPSSSSSSSSVVVYNVTRSSVSITYYPVSFDLLQGASVSKAVIVANGNTTQYNVTLNLSGLNASWYSISPIKIDSLGPRYNGSFMISFYIPSDAQFMTYPASIKVTTSNISVNDSINFSLRVLPSNQTIEEQIKPSLANYSARIDALEQIYLSRISNYSDANQMRIANLIKFARSRLSDASGLIDQGNYSQSADVVTEVTDLTNDLQDLVQMTEQPIKADAFLLIILIAGVIVAAGVVAYLFWPHQEAGYSRDAGWLAAEKGGLAAKFKRLVKKKRADSYLSESKKSKP